MKSIKDIIEEGNNIRRKTDKIEELINNDGFYKVYGGRSGTIYFVEDGRICELYYEFGGNGSVSVDLNDLSDWIFPINQIMTETEKSI